MFILFILSKSLIIILSIIVMLQSRSYTFKKIYKIIKYNIIIVIYTVMNSIVHIVKLNFITT